MTSLFISTKIIYNVENDLAEQYRISAEKGSAEAQYQLARRYEEGDWLSKDIDEALKLYLKAAEQGHCGAQLRLGHIYYWGEDVKQDYNESNKWYRQAAEQGDMCAQYCLGLAYTEGLGTPQNYMDIHLTEFKKFKSEPKLKLNLKTSLILIV